MRFPKVIPSQSALQLVSMYHFKFFFNEVDGDFYLIGRTLQPATIMCLPDRHDITYIGNFGKNIHPESSMPLALSYILEEKRVHSKPNSTMRTDSKMTMVWEKDGDVY